MNYNSPIRNDKLLREAYEAGRASVLNEQQQLGGRGAGAGAGAPSGRGGGPGITSNRLGGLAGKDEPWGPGNWPEWDNCGDYGACDTHPGPEVPCCSHQVGDFLWIMVDGEWYFYYVGD